VRRSKNFIHELEIFNPDKVLAVRNPDTFTFSYMVIGGFKNLKLRLITKWKDHNNHVSFMPLDDSFGNCGDKEYPYLVKDKIDMNFFDSNNPANILLSKESTKKLPKKEQLLYDKLTDFQKKILEMRREGKTFIDIGNALGCSSTKIRRYYSDAKNTANKIFGVNYER
jgi:DNA-directed RNA polymerase specialized sigma subunit